MEKKTALSVNVRNNLDELNLLLSETQEAAKYLEDMLNKINSFEIRLEIDRPLKN